MPVEYVASGPDIERNGKPVTPTAPLYICEHCGYRGAAFVVKHGEHVLAYCGWEDRRPVCVEKGRKHPSDS